MPKTAVNKQGDATANKNDIGIARNILAMKPKPVTHAMQHRAHALFRNRIFAANATHVPRAPFLVQTIQHATRYLQWNADIKCRKAAGAEPWRGA